MTTISGWRQAGAMCVREIVGKRDDLFPPIPLSDMLKSMLALSSVEILKDMVVGVKKIPLNGVVGWEAPPPCPHMSVDPQGDVRH